MEPRNVVSILIVVLLLLLSLLVGLLGGCLMGGMACGYAGFMAGAASSQPSPQLPRVVTTPVPPAPSLPTPVPGMPGRVGALITDVVSDSPADEAGLRVGDIILSVDRQQLDAERDLASVITQYRPGDEVTLGVWRRGSTEFIRVRLGAHPDERGRAYLGVYYQSLGDMGGHRTPFGD